MRATDLAKLDHAFAETEATRDQMNVELDRLEKSLTSQNEIVKGLKDKVAEFEKLEKYNDRLAMLQVHFAYAYYREAEEKLAAYEDSVTSYQAKKAKYEELLLEMQAEAAAPDEGEAKHRALMEELTNEAKEQSEHKKELDMKLTQLLQPYKRLQREQTEMASQEKELDRKLRKAKARLEKARQELLANSEEKDDAARLEQLHQLQSDLETAKKTSNEMASEVSESLRKYEDLEPDVMDARSQVKRSKRDLDVAQRELDDLGRDGGNDLAKWGGREVTAVFQKVCESCYDASKKLTLSTTGRTCQEPQGIFRSCHGTFGSLHQGPPWKGKACWTRRKGHGLQVVGQVRGHQQQRSTHPPKDSRRVPLSGKDWTDCFEFEN